MPNALKNDEGRWVRVGDVVRVGNTPRGRVSSLDKRLGALVDWNEFAPDSKPQWVPLNLVFQAEEEML